MAPDLGSICVVCKWYGKHSPNIWDRLVRRCFLERALRPGRCYAVAREDSLLHNGARCHARVDCYRKLLLDDDLCHITGLWVTKYLHPVVGDYLPSDLAFIRIKVGPYPQGAVAVAFCVHLLHQGRIFIGQFVEHRLDIVILALCYRKAHEPDRDCNGGECQ